MKLKSFIFYLNILFLGSCFGSKSLNWGTFEFGFFQEYNRDILVIPSKLNSLICADQPEFWNLEEKANKCKRDTYNLYMKEYTEYIDSKEYDKAAQIICKAKREIIASGCNDEFYRLILNCSEFGAQFVKYWKFEYEIFCIRSMNGVTFGEEYLQFIEENGNECMRIYDKIFLSYAGEGGLLKGEFCGDMINYLNEVKKFCPGTAYNGIVQEFGLQILERQCGIEKMI